MYNQFFFYIKLMKLVNPKNVFYSKINKISLLKIQHEIVITKYI